jgi:drug/metabolite transporter (DMT)-like permease
MLMISMLGLFSALTMSPISMVTALSFVSPVFASMIAILVLRERASARRWFAVAGGFVGMLLIVRPGGRAAVAEAGVGDLRRDRLGGVDHRHQADVDHRVEHHASDLHVGDRDAAHLPARRVVWKWPSWQLLPVLVYMAFIATVGQFAYTKSFKYAEATALMPLDFTRLVWAGSAARSFPERRVHHLS